MRRPKPLHAPALLIDEDGASRPTQSAEICDKRADLRRRLDIALEQDEPEGLAVADEAPSSRVSPDLGNRR